ncbi:MAG: hypothetical protein H0W58_10170 [Acidobacteria bacterium]|nr:hypothetical protein [Acidobacteriota bacterium]
MKNNKNLMKFVIILVCLLCLNFTVDAQKRRTPRKKTRTPAATSIPPSNIEIKNGAGKVAIQIKNLTKFIYVLGGVAKSIEDIDKDAKTSNFSQTTLNKNTENKQRLIQSIRNFRAGLIALEIEFRTKPALRNYLFPIQGISDISGTAEEQSTAGQFTESGKTLLLVVEKLADTLAALP